MKKLLIILLLISPFSFADWGDVYYCQEISHAITDNNGKIRKVELSTFQFKLDETKNAMVFGSSGRLAEKVVPLREGEELGFPWWFAEDDLRRIYFREGTGKFLEAGTGALHAWLMSANCDKF